jgi:hypothetical protein
MVAIGFVMAGALMLGDDRDGTVANAGGAQLGDGALGLGTRVEDGGDELVMHTTILMLRNGRPIPSTRE